MDILISEKQHEDIKDILKDVIKEEGIKSAAKLVNGIENLFKVFEITTPIQFLNLYNDLEMVNSEENSNHILFRYIPGHNIMLKTGPHVGISWDDVWEILWSRHYFKMENDQIKKLTLQWIHDTYNLNDVKVTIDLRNPHYIKSL